MNYIASKKESASLGTPLPVVWLFQLERCLESDGTRVDGYITPVTLQAPLVRYARSGTRVADGGSRGLSWLELAVGWRGVGVEGGRRVAVIVHS